MPDGSVIATEITATLFYSYGATRKTERRFTWPQLRADILGATAMAKADLPWIKLARFGDQKTDKGSLRHDANVLAITGIEADYDGERVTLEEAVEKLEKAGVKAMVYTSPSHTEDTPRWRVLCPTSTELPPDRREHLVGRLNGVLGGILAGESFTLSQSYYFGSVNRSPSHRAELVDGQPIDLCDELDVTWIGRPATKTATDANGKPRQGKADVAELLAEIVTGAAYHHAAVRLAGVWAASGVPYMDARKRLEAAFDAIPEDQRDARWKARRDDLDRCLQDIYGKEAGKKDRGEKRHRQQHDDDERGSQDSPAGRGLPLLLFEEIEAVTEASDFVQGVLAERSSAVVYGESNAGKTFWTTDLALHVAAGKTWNGRRVDQGGVIYCPLEGGAGFRNRVAAWKKQHCKPGETIPFAAVPASLDLLDPTADTPRLIEKINEAARLMGHPVKLVVIDTLSRALAGGNENASEDMGALVRNMDLIREKTGACVMFIHHSGKDQARGARGHSLLRAAIDTEIEVRADETTGAKTATVLKQREMAKGAAFGFRLEVVKLGSNQHGEDVTTCTVHPEDAKPAEPGKRSLTATEKGWLQDLTDMFAEPGEAETRPPASGMPSVLTLTREQVRSGYRKRGRFGLTPDGALTGADRERLRAMLNTLKDKGKISMTADLVWLI